MTKAEIDEVTCIEDQILDAVRDALNLDFEDDLEIQERKLFGREP